MSIWLGVKKSVSIRCLFFFQYFGSNGFSYGSSWKNWRSLALFARKNGLIFCPSIAPGYVDTRVRAWNTKTTRSRRNGAYYDLAWKTFEQLLENGPEGQKLVSITSFNEWHEGTQIESAVTKTARNYTYNSYAPASANMYLDKTKIWIDKLLLS